MWVMRWLQRIALCFARQVESLVLLFSDKGDVELTAGAYLPVDRDVLSGDGTVSTESGDTLIVGESPVLVGPPGSFP